jgi:Acetyltransferase (GNAT) family.
MELIHTDGKDERFINLCRELDDFLNEIVGGKKQRDKYNQYNILADIHDVILVIEDGQAVGCGSFKRYNENVAEIKWVFVKKEYRRKEANS